MNREIKFRAWDGFNREMITPYLAINDEGWILSHKTHSPFVMQFSGLKDKHGKEIYEGDVVQLQAGEDYHGCREINVRGVIEWCGFGFDLVTAGVGQGLHMAGYGGELEVLGNIYENPDLLPR